MKRYLHHFVLLGYLIVMGLNCVWAQDIYIGMEKADLLEVMGEPISQASKGDRELIYYPGGIQITLRDGKVRKVKGTDYAYFPPDQVVVEEQPEEVPPEPEEALPVVMSEAEVPEIVEEEPAVVDDGDAAMIDAVTDYNRFSRNEMSDEEAKEAFKNLMAAELDMSEGEADYLLQGMEEPDEEEAAMQTMVAQLFGFIIYFLATLAVVKIGLMFFGIVSLWREVFLIAFCYASFHLILSFIPYGLDMRELFKVDDVLGFPVLTLLTFHLTALNQGVIALKIGLAGAVVCYFAFKIVMLIGALAAFQMVM